MYGEGETDWFLQHGGSIHNPAGDVVQSAQDDWEASEKMYDMIQRELDATLELSVAYPTSSSTYKYWPSSQIKSGVLDRSAVGLAALEFHRWSATGQSVTVLVFRGTITSGDRQNIINWVHDFVTNSGMTKRMKEMWVDEANLPWTDEMEKRSKVNLPTSDRLG